MVAIYVEILAIYRAPQRKVVLPTLESRLSNDEHCNPGISRKFLELFFYISIFAASHRNVRYSMINSFTTKVSFKPTQHQAQEVLGALRK